jgi:hypothetical protein
MTQELQPCINCGVLVNNFLQWFTEDCPGNPQGHQVLDWTVLEFKQETIAAARELHSRGRGKQKLKENLDIQGHRKGPYGRKKLSRNSMNFRKLEASQW